MGSNNPSYQTVLNRQRSSPKYPNYLPAVGTPDPKPFSAVGFTSGVGSMLIGARDAGFQVLGNLEWRDYYRMVDEANRNTFTHNFAGAFMARGLADLHPFERESLFNADLAMGHPECGSYSNLNTFHKPSLNPNLTAGDIPLYLRYVAELKPKFFVMDDLPKSFLALTMAQYVELLPDYDLFPEWISNYHYGNPQYFRRRMFMIGARKEFGFTFVPGEREGWPIWTTAERIANIPAGDPNHLPHDPESRIGPTTHLRFRGDRPLWKDVAPYLREHVRLGNNAPYFMEDGSLSRRPSFARSRPDRCSVLTGLNPILHFETCDPFTIRERARIQGFPDDFIFYGMQTRDGYWDHAKNTPLVKQTGKAMPVEFNRYIANQVRAHLEGVNQPEATGQRLIFPNPDVTQAKVDFCREGSYSNQQGACAQCWLNEGCAYK